MLEQYCLPQKLKVQEHHSKHTVQPTAPLSLPAGPASTAVIILRTAQVEADGRETPPPCFLLWNHSPCLKSTISFPCPSLNCSDSAPAASAATPPCSNQLLHYSAFPSERTASARGVWQQGRQGSWFTRLLAKQHGADDPRWWRKQEISQLCCKSQAQRKGSRESEAPGTLFAQTPALIQAQQDAAGQREGCHHDSSGSPLRGDKHAFPSPAGWVSRNRSTRTA